ncbi:DUF7282 domain-containing protein [Natronococcus wangiae]|uniref:DUF7282 domain-containing protein n=1 Tax=Natronococcus wangiae TaxID=3068275 RepID=UPI00273D4E4B|nr:DUF4179 domain-containing protein [Natronococcus sp. AD5]
MSSRPTFGTIKRVVAVLIAITVVLAAGIVVGQAPAIFGVEEDSEATIAFEDQQTDGTNVTIDEVSLSDGGFVVITDGGNEPIAASEYLDRGTHQNVTIERSEGDPELVGQLTATVHQDTDDDETYTYEETDGEEDLPYLEGGYPVSDTATVTATGNEAVSDSFTVESVDAPATATTDQTIEVDAEIRNPTDFDQQQNIEVRIGGSVIERQVLELGGGDSSEVTFEVDTTGTSPGTRILGVYTEDHGELQEIELEFHTDPSVTVVDASEDEVTVDVATPESGFVAVEDDEEVLGTSGELEAGEHDNVTVEFDENATVDEDDELTVVVYGGDPADVEAASPIEHEGESVEETFTVADVRAEADAEDGADENGESGEGDGEG